MITLYSLTRVFLKPLLIKNTLGFDADSMLNGLDGRPLLSLFPLDLCEGVKVSRILTIAQCDGLLRKFKCIIEFYR